MPRDPENTRHHGCLLQTLFYRRKFVMLVDTLRKLNFGSPEIRGGTSYYYGGFNGNVITRKAPIDIAIKVALLKI